MKKTCTQLVTRGLIPLLTVALTLTATTATAQSSNNDHQVVQLAPHTRHNCVPGEVLVQFKPGVTPQIAQTQLKAAAVTSPPTTVDNLLAQYDVQEIEPIVNNAQAAPKRYPAPAGVKILNGTLYRLKIGDTGNNKGINPLADMYALIEELKKLPEVEFAEPNYLLYSLGNPVDEPLYSQQWGIPAVKLPSLWQKATLPNGQRKVIAIIDTGVDIEHPDLKENIWTNAGEVGGVANRDNDGNGYRNDLHGWDFVNNTPNVRDNNAHGTHCAGIAAAPANGIGITGANPNALIMPLAALQSNGTGDIATIIKAVNYAAQNGADVISMSLGTYAYSIAFEQALAQAYQTAVLVGAAGNDALEIDPRCSPNKPPTGAPTFPGAFAFVLGVQATQQNGSLASFSNYDCDGPVFSQYSEEQLYNYELKAPGVGIYSTIPGGNYRNMNGTSMATPLVAGGVSALLDRKEFPSQEMLWTTLIQSANDGVVNFEAAYSYVPKPELAIVSILTDDTAEGDSDMRPDAGELLEIYPTIKNAGGTTSNIRFSLEFAEFEDQSVVEIENPTANFGGTLTAYSKMKAQNPIRIRIKPDVVDGRNISMVLKAWYDENEGEVSQKLILNVENGVELNGMIMADMTLYPNTHYIVTDNLAIPEGVTLTIKPGTVLKFKDNAILSSAGNIYAVGKPDSLIVFTKTDLGIGNGKVTVGNTDIYGYCKIEYIQLGISERSTQMSNCIITNNRISEVRSGYPNYNLIKLNQSNFINNTTTGVMIWLNFNSNQYYNNVSNNIANSLGRTALMGGGSNGHSYYMQQSNIYSNYTTTSGYSISANSSTPQIISTDFPCYWGSSVENIARKNIFDFKTPNSGVFGQIDLSNMRTRPYAEAHGIVWKVVVNGYDAQDEFEQLPPLGVGKHKFEVYFNRPMNKAVTPMVAMGVRPPYTQNAIGEDGAWNAAGDVYTAYFTVKAASATDGLNRIYVANAQDNEFFEIPYENQRFNVLVQSAGSLSSGFAATAGLGLVNLEWEAPEEYFDDLLGYNMYRTTYNKNTGQYSDTTMINQTLLFDPKYTDFDVVPGTTYNYMYKVMRTSLTENNYSRSVSAVPFTAAKGDSNGSLKIDVADIVTTVAYIMGQNPQPFIFEAADVNSDGVIDVLDVVGTVTLILNPELQNKSINTVTAEYTVENGILYVESSEALGGVQCVIKISRTAANIKALAALEGFEQASQWLDDNTFMFLSFSMSGKVIPVGKQALLQIGENAEITSLVLADTRGGNVNVENAPEGGDTPTSIAVNVRTPLKLYPNPFNSSLRIQFYLENTDNQKVDIIFTDLSGRIIEQASAILTGGSYEIEWTPKTKLNTGVYICKIRVNGREIASERVLYNE
ncbi:MAG: S8 family serine peptidase [Bacteroidetes bacterium]|nr:S8 family serine peptidase [Bacteroidota bacterium]